jgi:type IV pilus secretin PilQ/predicted competence protein
MINPKNGWIGIMIQSAVATLVFAAVAMGCATPEAPSGATASSVVQTIGEVSVTRDGDDSVVWFAGLIDPTFSVTTPGDETLVVIDLVGVGKPDAESLMGAVRDEDQQVAVYDGVVDLVTVSTFEEAGEAPLTRIEIVMSDAGRAQVEAILGGLEIRVIPGVASLWDVDVSQNWESEAVNDAPVTESWQAVGDDADTNEVVFPLSVEEAPIVVVEPPPAAMQLVRVTAKVTEAGVLIGLEADGAINALEAFTLKDPARLVVDFPGLTVGEGAQGISVQSAYVSGVRIGAHEDKVRIVVDGGTAANDFSGRQVMPGTTGLWISIGGGDALAQAMTDALAASEDAWIESAAPIAVDSVEEGMIVTEAADLVLDTNEGFAPTVAAFDTEPTHEDVAELVVEEVAVIEEVPLAMEAFGLTEVYGLHYNRTHGLDRTAILADESVEYIMTSPDATTLVVSITNARISEEASDRIFPMAGGPVSLIHAFQQPEVSVPEVRVVFTRAPNQEPVVSRRGSMLFVDFQDEGVAAAAPPAFPNAGADDEAQMNVAVPAPASTPAGLPYEPPVAIDVAMPMADAAAALGSAPAAIDTAMAPVPVAAGLGTPLPGFESDPSLAAMSVADPANMWDVPVAASAAPAAVEVPAAIEVLEEGGLIDGKEYRGRRVSLDFKDVAISDVLRLIAEVSDLNIIAGDEVSGNVTIRLVEVPWDQALDVILMTKGLGFVRVGNVLRIAPSDVLKAEEEVRLQERRNKEKLEDLEVKLLPVNYAAVKDTEGLVKRLLSARGTVNIDERTNTLIIKDISSVIDEASALIAAIDTQTPQVMIEAKIVEANLDFSRELGSVWGIQTNQFTNAFDPDTPRTDLGSEDLTFIDNNSLAFANPITAVPTGLATVGALILDQDFRVDAQIQAAESTGDGKVVSSPRIVTLDNKEAKIEQGVSIPFQTFEGGDAKLEFIDAVLSLIVTPHITADESIIMEIQVTRNAPDSTVPTPTGSPAIAKNVAETETLVKDGQTLVLGGIYTITKSKTSSRIPYLHRIPVIGNAFKSNSVTDSRKELLVFVTPRIVRLPEMSNN